MRDVKATVDALNADERVDYLMSQLQKQAQAAILNEQQAATLEKKCETFRKERDSGSRVNVVVDSLSHVGADAL
jgi:hypothetical protein